jgi:flagellar L-ring protein precursor FlgH
MKKELVLAAFAMLALQGAPSLAQPSASAPAAGSLYSEHSFAPLTGDRRLFKAGDLVTVVIYENATASSTADTGVNRDQSLGISANSWSMGQRNAGIGTTNDFNGGGSTERAGKLLAQMTVAVQQVLPNGDLALGGEQVIEINGERQTISLQGRVRPSDVTELNTVLSSRIADAQISFVGHGVVGEHQQPGWWHHLLTLFGL